MTEYTSTLTSPINVSKPVTPNDSADLPDGPARVLYIGVAGNVTLVGMDDGEVTYANVAAGWFPVRAKRVKATGTTATSIVAGY